MNSIIGVAQQYNSTLIVCCLLLLVWGALRLMRRNMINSNNKWISLFGRNFKLRYFIIAIAIVVLNDVSGVCWSVIFNADNPFGNRVWQVTIVFCWCLLAIYYCLQLKKTFKIKNDHVTDAFNFWIQNTVVIISGLFLIFIVCVLNIKSDNFLAFSIFTFILGIVFKDIIVGILAFYHMRSMGQLRIGDWIEIPSKGIDGKIMDVSLVTVKIKNFDNTVSSIPVATLQSDHLKNNQDMLGGKTEGRRMLKKFFIDTESIKPLNDKEKEEITERLKAIGSHMQWDANTEPLNIHYFREYIYHWLKSYGYVSSEPRMMVRYLEHTPEGLPLQVYTFITETPVMSFEKHQSKIFEHVILTLDIFGLKLFQSPSGYALKEFLKK